MYKISYFPQSGDKVGMFNLLEEICKRPGYRLLIFDNHGNVSTNLFEKPTVVAFVLGQYWLRYKEGTTHFYFQNTFEEIMWLKMRFPAASFGEIRKT